MELKVAILGTGNIAWHLVHGLKEKECLSIKVWGRDSGKTSSLVESTSCCFDADLDEVCRDADIIILAVTDRAILELASRLKSYVSAVIAHTSGSVDMQSLAPYCASYGVFYPLNTFSSSVQLDWASTPFFIEGKSKQEEVLLKKLADVLSENIYFVNSEVRRKLHIAAVFACNFTNYFYVLAEGLLEQNNLSFDLLRPLIKQTADKALLQSPKSIQTGPAVRKDMAVIESHLDALVSDAKLMGLYKIISESILREENL